MINRTVLMSGAEHFTVQEINPYSFESDQPDRKRVIAEHDAIESALIEAGVEVIRTPAPRECKDGVYTANWALIHGQKAVLSRLPGPRQNEEPHARQVLADLGFELIEPPVRFSGQGDALFAGNTLFCGQGYRTDSRVHDFIHDVFEVEVVSLQTIPLLYKNGHQAINKLTGWPDSYFYDIDLALAVLDEDLIAWCPEAFMPESREKLWHLEGFRKIEVSMEEAKEAFACNLVSTGETVVMSAHAPLLKEDIEAVGLRVVTPEISELAKGGGYIRCTTLTLKNT